MSNRSWAAANLALISFLLAAPFLLPEYPRFVITLALINIIAVMGVNVTMGYAGQISLGHAGFAAIGAYATALLMVHYDLSFWTAMVVGTALAGAFGFALGLPTLRLGPLYVSMVTFGFGVVVVLILQNWYDLANGPNGMAMPVPTFFGWDLPPIYFHFVVVGICVLVFAGTWNIVHSRSGRAFVAVRESEIAARSMGINIAHVKTLAFALGAACGGLSGSLFGGLTQFVNPDAFVFNVSISYVTMTILGGSGFISGPAVGGFLLTVLPEILRGAGEYKDFITGLLLLLLLIFLPNGVVGLLKRWRLALLGQAPADLKAELTVSPLNVSPATGKHSGDLLTLGNVTVTFGGLAALRNVSFKIGHAEILGLIGPNGAGKTTLFNVISGIYLPDAGEICLKGENIITQPAHRRTEMGICRTFQNVELFKKMSVMENVLVGAHVHLKTSLWQNIFRTPAQRRSEALFRENANELLNFVGLRKFSSAEAASLSFGHQRLLEIARALAARPKLLMLDEPAAGLNSAELESLMAIIGRIRDELHISVLLIGHTMRLVMGLSDRIVVIDHGEKIAEGSPPEIQKNQRVLEAYLGAADA